MDTSKYIYNVYPKWEDSVFINPKSGCDPLDVSFNLNYNSLTYEILFGDNTSSTSSQVTHTYYNNLNSINIQPYLVHIYAYGTGCRDSLLIPDTIKVYPRANADFTWVQNSQPYPKQFEVDFTNTSQNASIFNWEFGDGGSTTDVSPSHNYFSEGNYTVTLTANNIYNCPNDTSQIIPISKKWNLYVPNAFSPSDFNQKVAHFTAIGKGLVEFKMEIYDTWGKLLWSTDKLIDTEPVEGWNGTLNGNLMPMDVYVWKIYARFMDGSVWKGMEQDGDIKTYGTVTLIR